MGKQCRICGETDLNKLVKAKKAKDGYRAECKLCRNKSQRGGPIKNNHLKRSYNITLAKYLDMLNEQNHSCLICKRHKNEFKKDLHVDHNHTTQKVRGLLCFNCNQGLGNMKDSILLLEAAIKYLKDKDG